jgi:hypothetical protein
MDANSFSVDAYDDNYEDDLSGNFFKKNRKSKYSNLKKMMKIMMTKKSKLLSSKTKTLRIIIFKMQIYYIAIAIN